MGDPVARPLRIAVIGLVHGHVEGLLARAAAADADLETEAGSIHAGRRDELTVRDPDRPPRVVRPAPLPGWLHDEWTYFSGVVRGTCAEDPLSSLEFNLVAVEILDEARRQIAAP